jgi:hypothetical protein
VVWLIVLLIVTFAAGDVLGLEMSLAPGLSVKNGLLYLIAFTILFRKALGGGERVSYVSIHVAFAVLICYASMSWLVTAYMIHYPGYRPLDGLINLKVRMIDPAMMLFAALYGLKDMKEVWTALKWLAGCIGLANFATLLDTAGIVHFGMRMGDSGAEEGRVFGAFGHANDTGALIVGLLPSMAMLAFSAQGAKRAAWAFASLCTVMVLLLTVSRGAFVGLAVGYTIAAIMCRRYVPVERFVLLAVGAAGFCLLAVLFVSLVDPAIGGTLVERLLGQSRSIDMTEASSGRTAIWAEALERMTRVPSTFLTGYGWDSYWTMPFRYAPHNYYIGLLFNLGIFAPLLVLLILARSVISMRAAIPHAEENVRLQLLAFVFGILGVAISIIFADLYKPWGYLWLYMGILLKAALLSQEVAVAPEPEQSIVRGVPIRLAKATVVGLHR